MSKIWDGLTKNTDTAKKNLTNAFNDIKALGPPLLNYFNGPFTNYLVTWVDTNGSILMDYLIALIQSFRMYGIKQHILYLQILFLLDYQC